MRGSRTVLAFAVGALSLGLGVWRAVRAFDGSSTSSTTISFPLAAPDPSCAEAANFASATCFDNPCNPTSAGYQAGNAACLPIGLPSPSGIPSTPGVAGQPGAP
jgi:hypothetical protein